MKKWLFVFTLALMSLILVACKSDGEKMADFYSERAFTVLHDYTESEVDVASVEWVCMHSEEVLDYYTESCYFIFRYFQSNNTIEQYVMVAVNSNPKQGTTHDYLAVHYTDYEEYFFWTDHLYNQIDDIENNPSIVFIEQGELSPKQIQVTLDNIFTP